MEYRWLLSLSIDACIIIIIIIGFFAVVKLYINGSFEPEEHCTIPK
jgi:hypothetical protein